MSSSAPNPLSPSGYARPLANETVLAFRIIHSFEEAESYKSAWNNLATRSEGDVYQTFEWCQTWWKYYGKHRRLHLILAFSGEDLVGLLPAFIETLRMGLVSIRAAKLVGADYSLALCNILAMPGSVSEVVAFGIDHFIGKARCDILLIGPLAGPAARIEDLLTLGGEKASLVGQTQLLGKTCNTFFTLPKTFELYLKQLDKKQRSNFKRRSEQSTKDHILAFDTVSAAESLESEFEHFCRQHEAQWHADGKLGHFGDWPNATEFNRDLIRTFADKGMVRFYRILSGGEVISSQYCFIFNGRAYWRLPSRVRTPEWDRFSLGTMGLVKMIETLISEGIFTVEGGRGHYAYKLHHGAQEYPMRTIQFTRRGLGTQIRTRTFALGSALLDIVYYKLIFARLASHFRFLQRPLWSVWIRATW